MASENSILIETHNKVQAKVDGYSVVGGKWGKPLPLDPNGPIYPFFPEGDVSGLGFVDTIAKFGRTGVYVGAAYGGGKITPTFKFEEFDLTKPEDWQKFNVEFNKYRPAGDGRGDGEFYVKPRELAPRSKFDAIAETHDLLQQDANLKYAEAYARAGGEYQTLLRQGADAATLKAAADKVAQTKQAAVDSQRKEYAESDGWITHELNQLIPGNPYEAVLKNIGGIVFATNFASEFIDQVGLKNAELAEKLGEAYGSKLGALIAGDGFFEQKFGLGTSIGAELGKSVANYFLVGGQVNLTDSLLSNLGPEKLLVGMVNNTLDDFGINIVGGLNPASFKGTANILLAEAAERLGLEGFEKYAFTETGQSITNYLLDSLSGGEVEAQGFASVINGDFNMSSVSGFLVDLAAKYMINNYMGSILNSARGLVSIDNRYEGYYAEIHAMAGQIIGTTIGTALTGPFFGSIIGKIAGTIGYIIGSISYETLDVLTVGLLDDWFTPNPVGVNYAVFNAATNRLEIDFNGSQVHWDRNGSSRTDFIKLWQIGNAGSDAYASYVNGVIESIEAHVDVSQFSRVLERGTRFNHASIGYHDHAFQVIRSVPGDKVHSQNMNAIVSAAVEYEMSKLIFQGGDLVQVRAINLWKSDTAMKVGGPGRGDADYILSANLLGARLQIAKDYRFYLENTETINYMMAHSPDSPFTVGWTATLLQAHEMRLDAPYQVLSRTALNNMATARNDMIHAADGHDVLYGADGDDLIKTYGGDDIVGGGNGNDTIHAGTGNDIAYGEAGSDEIWLGAGNDTVSGGLGNDTIDGGGGIDVAYIDAKFSAVSITRDGSRLLTSGPQGAHTYSGVELLIFEGGRVFINATHKIGGFDEGFYLDHNPDVAAAVKAGIVKSGHEHWTKWGKAEGRNAIDATANLHYDETFYLAANPDVADAVLSGRIVNGYAHYEQWGKAEGRDSVPLFDKAYYLSRNPDVKASGMDPWTHYMKYGWREGRDPSAFFDTSAYLDQNPDVKAAGVNPFEHAQLYGFAEERTVLATPDFALFSNYLLI